MTMQLINLGTAGAPAFVQHDGSFPKAQRALLLTAAVIRDKDLRDGDGSAQFRKLADPANAVYWPAPKNRNMPRGGWGTYSFAFPVRLTDKGWQPLENAGKTDIDLEPLPGLAVLGGSTPSIGAEGVAVQTTAHDGSETVVLPTSPGQLVAHHRPIGQPTLSSQVGDTDGDSQIEIRAGLHGALRVAKLPESNNPIPMHATSNALALNLARSGGREPDGSITGYGLAAFSPDGGGTAVVNALRSFGFLAHTLMKGPLTVYADGAKDIHSIARNADGEWFQSAAINTDAFFLHPASDGARYNAPLHFDARTEIVRRVLGYDYRAPIVWNPEMKHTGPTRDGLDGRWVVAYALSEQLIQPGLTPIDPGIVAPPEPVPSQPVPPPVGPVPPFRRAPFEQMFPSWRIVPRPCILKGQPMPQTPTDPNAYVDPAKALLGFSTPDYAAMPMIGHFVATGQLAVTSPIAGQDGVAACPPAYTRPPSRPVTGRESIPGTANGVLNLAPPELDEHQLRHDYTAYPSAMSTATLNIWGRAASSGNGVLGFGRVSSDLGSVVDGYRFQMDSSGVLCVAGYDAAGIQDATKKFCFDLMVCMPETPSSGLSLQGCTDSDTGLVWLTGNALGVQATTHYLMPSTGTTVTMVGEGAYLSTANDATPGVSIVLKAQNAPTGAFSNANGGDLTLGSGSNGGGSGTNGLLNLATGGTSRFRLDDSKLFPLVNTDGSTGYDLGGTSNYNRAVFAHKFHVRDGGGVYFDSETGSLVHDGTDILTFNQNYHVTGRVQIGGNLYESWVTPAQITANQNDYVLASGINFRLTSDANNRTITGIAAPSPDGGRVVTLFNAGSFNIRIDEESASSTAANRIITGVGTVSISSGDSVTLKYDTTSDRWRVSS